MREAESWPFQAGSVTIVVLGLMGSFAVPSALAQSAALDEVVVLAQKRPTELHEVPVSMSTLTAADMQAAGIRDIEGAALRSPILDYQETTSAATVTLRIRRVGNLGNIPTFEPAVGLFVDGAYRSRSMLSSGELLDVERIETLRGPQTALYGRNTSAGVVAVYTREPAESFEANAETTFGFLDVSGRPALAGLSATMSGPLADSLRGGLAFGGDWHAETTRNALPAGPDGNAQGRAAARAQLLWTPSEQLVLRLIAGYLAHDSKEGESDVVFVPGAGSTNVLAALQQQGLTGRCPDNRPRNRVSCSTATNRLNLDAVDATLIADYRFENGWTLHSITGHERYRDERAEDDVVQLLSPILFFHDSEEGVSWQEELRLASADDSRMPWLVGAFWYESDYERGSRGRRPMFGPNGDLAFDSFWESLLGFPLALPGQEGLHDSSLNSDYLGAFGEVTVPMGGRFDLTAALRRARETRRASIDNEVSAPGVSLISRVLTPESSPNGAAVDGRLSRSSEATSWSLTPRLRVGDDYLLYATWARGAKFGGFNTGFGNGPLDSREFGDETIDHLEAGGRVRLGGGHGRLSVSAFRTHYHDYQDAAFISAQFTVGNAELLELEGAELDVSYQFGAGTLASVELSYADLVYAKNTTGMCYPGRIPDGSLPGSCDLSGERPIAAPPWAAAMGIEQPFRIGGKDAAVRLDWAWTDRYQTSFSADPRLVQAAFHDVALRMSVQLSDKVELEVAGHNVLDETVAVVDAVMNFFNDASINSYVAQPRRFALIVRARL
jgi:iron complex outermembrane recepter protein